MKILERHGLATLFALLNFAAFGLGVRQYRSDLKEAQENFLRHDTETVAKFSETIDRATNASKENAVIVRSLVESVKEELQVHHPRR